MSVLYGVLDYSNHSDCLGDLATMMHAWEKGDSSSWHSAQVCLGQSTFHTTPESFSDTLPLFLPEQKLTIIGDMRLDNRNELFSELAIPQHQQQLYGDCRLVAAAYEKWAEACPKHLIGDFAFAIWDGHKEKLFCCTDHFGINPLFYFFDGKKFVFSSDINPITAVKNIPVQLNEHKLAGFYFFDARPLYREETWFRGICQMPAATVLTIDSTGIKQHRYWAPQPLDELHFKNEGEFTEAFREVFFRAVGDRLRSNTPVSALLSGGLDSSSIVGAAAKILEQQNKELQVFSAVLPENHNPELTDERYFIDQFKSFPNIKINYITAPGQSFLSASDKFQQELFAPDIISRYYLSEAFSEKAASLGSRVILSGGHGEFGPTFDGDGGYAEWFLKLRWRKLWNELKARKALTGEPVKANLYRNVLMPLMPGFLFDATNRRNGVTLNRANSLNADLAETLRAETERIKAISSPLSVKKISASSRRNQLDMLRNIQQKARGNVSNGIVQFRSPMMDKRLLEFCLRVPLDFKIKNGYKRSIVRIGLDGILPPEIQWRNSKGAYSPDYNQRYMEHLPAARKFAEAIAINDPVRRIVDIEKLKKLLDIPVAVNDHYSFAAKVARDIVPETIYLICFLRRFSEFQTK